MVLIMTVGQRICSERTKKGWSQEELARRMGYKTRNAIYQYEKAENMKLSLIQKFADVLGCTTSYLAGWDEEESAEERLRAAYIEQSKNSELLNNAKAYEELLMYFAQLSPEKQDSVLNLLKTML